MNEILDKVYKNALGETKKLGEIIDRNEFYTSISQDGTVEKRFIKKSGIFKIANFLGVKFSPMQIVQTPERWNQYNYAVTVTAIFPTTGEESIDVGESTGNIENPMHKLTFAFERARKRAIMNSFTVGLHNLVSEEEVELAQQKLREVQDSYKTNNILSKTNYIANEEYTNNQPQFQGIEDLDINSFFLPEGDKYEGRTLFELLKLDFEHLKKLREIYPQNMKLIQNINALSSRYIYDNQNGTNQIELFENDFLKAITSIHNSEPTEEQNRQSQQIDTSNSTSIPDISPINQAEEQDIMDIPFLLDETDTKTTTSQTDSSLVINDKGFNDVLDFLKNS